MNTLIFTPAWKRVAAWKVLQIMNIICCVCRPIPLSLQGFSTFPPCHHENSYLSMSVSSVLGRVRVVIRQWFRSSSASTLPYFSFSITKVCALIKL